MGAAEGLELRPRSFKRCCVPSTSEVAFNVDGCGQPTDLRRSGLRRKSWDQKTFPSQGGVAWGAELPPSPHQRGILTTAAAQRVTRALELPTALQDFLRHRATSAVPSLRPPRRGPRRRRRYNFCCVNVIAQFPRPWRLRRAAKTDCDRPLNPRGGPRKLPP